MSGIKGWERAVPIKRPDNLCATNFSQKAFVPSYEKYRRLWFEERAAWQIEAYPNVKKESVMKTLEDKWRERLKDKMKGKKGKENASDKKKPCKNKYRNVVSKTDSGRGIHPSPPKGHFPCKLKEPGISPAEGNLPSQEEVKLGPQEMGSLTSQRQGSRSLARESPIVQEKESYMNQGVRDLEQQSTEDVPCPEPQGNELVAKCPRCATFHPLREKCPAVVLCKDQAFRERIMRNIS